MEERRNNARTLCYLDVIDPANGRLLGSVNNINHGGLLLISKNEIPLQEDIHVLIQFPNNPVKTRLVITGLWNQCNRDPDFYYTGCRIVDASSEGMDMILSMNETLKTGSRKSIKFSHYLASA